MYSRRDFGRIALASIPLSAYAAKINSVVGGVHLGMMAYRWSDYWPPRGAGRSAPGASDETDECIQQLTDVGLGECELMSVVLEPQSQLPEHAQGPAALKARETLRQWRLTTPMSHFTAVRQKFDSAGITLHAYFCEGMGDDFTDAEINKLFEQAKALRVNCMSAKTQVAVAQKLIPFAEKHKMIVAFHNKVDVKNSNAFATAESFQKAFDMSKWYMANVDIGHMTAANIDVVSYVEKNHARINFIHVKDKKRNLGPSTPWGEGDTPIKEVLQLIKKNRYPIPCYLELDYRTPPGSTISAEVKKCLAYMRQALA